MLRHVATALLLIASAPSRAEMAMERIPLPAGFAYPNGIAQGADGTLYVGSVTSGQVLRLRPGVSDWETLFAGSPAIFAGTSLRLDERHGLLWGASPDLLGTRRADGSVERRPHRIFALDARTGAPQRLLPMPDGGFGNDLAIDPAGGVFVTDSTLPRVLRLTTGADRFETYVEDERFRPDPAGAPGLAGVALAPDGTTLAVNHYGNGRLLLVRPGAEGRPLVVEVPLARRLENPDGMRFMPDGRLLVVEGAVQSGDGRLLRIDLLGRQSEDPVPVEVLASELQSPVNLALGREGRVWVTEARIRHRLLPGGDGSAAPEGFWVTRLELAPAAPG